MSQTMVNSSFYQGKRVSWGLKPTFSMMWSSSTSLVILCHLLVVFFIAPVEFWWTWCHTHSLMRNRLTECIVDSRMSRFVSTSLWRQVLVTLIQSTSSGFPHTPVFQVIEQVGSVSISSACHHSTTRVLDQNLTKIRHHHGTPAVTTKRHIYQWLWWLTIYHTVLTTIEPCWICFSLFNVIMSK